MPVTFPCDDLWKLLMFMETATALDPANESPPQKNDTYRRYSCAGKGCNFANWHIAPCESTVRISDIVETGTGPYLSRSIPGKNLSMLPVKYSDAIKPYWFAVIWNVDLISFMQAAMENTGPGDKHTKPLIANIIHLLERLEVYSVILQHILMKWNRELVQIIRRLRRRRLLLYALRWHWCSPVLPSSSSPCFASSSCRTTFTKMYYNTFPQQK